MNLIHDFYTAFKNKDAEAMCACYADDVEFEDPAFGKLKGEHAKNMWRMLLESQKDKDFEVTFSDVQLQKGKGTAKWEAKYIYSKSGRPVHNLITAAFEIENGKIIKHTDSFSLKKWAKQALGFKGALLGGTRFFKKAMNQQTAEILAKWERK
ncbi:MAG: nuclear transport factor 2 family protein [Crocinitomicaceae bacterium]